MERKEFLHALPCLSPVPLWPLNPASAGGGAGASPSGADMWAGLTLSVEASSALSMGVSCGWLVFLAGGDDPAEMTVDVAALTTPDPTFSQSSNGSARSPGSVSTSLSMASPRPQIPHHRLELWLRVGDRCIFKVDRSEILGLSLEPSAAENEAGRQSKPKPASLVLDFGCVLLRFYYKDTDQHSFQRMSALHLCVTHVIQGTVPAQNSSGSASSPKNGSSGSSNSTSGGGVFSPTETPSGQQLARPDWVPPSYERFRRLQRLLHQPMLTTNADRALREQLALVAKDVRYATKSQAAEECRNRLGQATRQHVRLEGLLAKAFSSKHQIGAKKRRRRGEDGRSRSPSVYEEDVYDEVKKLVESQKQMQKDLHCLSMLPTRS